LTAAAVRTLRTPGKYLDGHGLVLLVVSAEKRYWTFRFKHDGRGRTMSLGNADVLSLADARRLHTEARGLLARGIDPLAQRQEARAEKRSTVSFAEAAAAYLTAHRAGWHSRTAEHWRTNLDRHVLPVFGAKPINAINVNDVLRCLTPLWDTKPVIAVSLRSRIELILDYARVRGWRPSDMANVATWRGNLRMLLSPPAKVHKVEHHPALDWRQVPALMAQLGPGTDETGTPALCLRFLILTATRSGEARGARWSEIDLATALWTVPAARMKAQRDHRVPLSDAALNVLRRLAAVRTGDLVFFGQRAGREVGDRSLKWVLNRLGHGHVTVHGFRSSFRDWCAETGKPSDVAEMALAHVVGSRVARAYQRSDLIDARRLIMQQWSEYLMRPPAEVVPLRVVG
jgi:integrase